jgi:hypothetical protein
MRALSNKEICVQNSNEFLSKSMFHMKYLGFFTSGITLKNEIKLRLFSFYINMGK